MPSKHRLLVLRPKPRIVNEGGNMRYHTHRLEVRLDDRDNKKLNALVERSGLPKSTVIRKMIDGEMLIEHPPIDYWNAYRCLEECRLMLHQADLLNANCRRCDACREAMKECMKTWEAHRKAFFDPSFFQAVNINDEEDENAN